jgi:hypothetical protein
VNLGQPLHRDPNPSLAVGALSGSGRRKAGEMSQRASLEYCFPARGSRLGGLPEEGPEGKPQGPMTAAGVDSVILLGKEGLTNPAPKDLLEGMQGHAAGTPEMSELGGKPGGPCGEHWRHGTVCVLSL